MPLCTEKSTLCTLDARNFKNVSIVLTTFGETLSVEGGNGLVLNLLGTFADVSDCI